MKVNAINVAEKCHKHNAAGVYETGLFKETVTSAVSVSALGLEGDCIVDTSVHGGLDQAVYIYLQEDYDWWGEQLGAPVLPGTFGENILIEGLADINIVIGDEIKIGDLVLEVTAPRVPCYKLADRMGSAAFLKQFVAANKPGFYGRVKQAGVIQAGVAVEHTATDKDYASICEVFYQWHAKDKSMAQIKKALDSPISEHHRVKLEGWYNKD